LSRIITSEEKCIFFGVIVIFYAKPYNTDGCNRESEEIEDVETCEAAILELLNDGIIGNSLNGGLRFGRTIVDENANAPYQTPTKCSYRESDAQLVFNPNPSGRGHTSLAPICSRTPRTEPDISDVGCLPKCLENGEWSAPLPTCEPDWCNPIFEEWSCCDNRGNERWTVRNPTVEQEADNNYNVEYLLFDYYQNKHELNGAAKCPLSYGDCDHDTECAGDNTNCGNKRDLDNIDVCIEDIDPCEGQEFATGIACRLYEAANNMMPWSESSVGHSYHQSVSSGAGSSLFIAGSIVILGAVLGYRFCSTQKGDEYTYLLEEEL
jgi:hypothetical protein